MDSAQQNKHLRTSHVPTVVKTPKESLVTRDSGKAVWSVVDRRVS